MYKDALTQMKHVLRKFQFKNAPNLEEKAIQELHCYMTNTNVCDTCFYVSNIVTYHSLSCFIHTRLVMHYWKQQLNYHIDTYVCAWSLFIIATLSKVQTHKEDQQTHAWNSLKPIDVVCTDLLICFGFEVRPSASFVTW